MRLINTTTLKLEEFVGTIPEYAILSHTWDNDEVVFEEFATAPHGTSQGHIKIANACRQAKDDGIGYCWVDTCCIAKSSSAELSEAINSMFNWYKNAKVCYAFLSDVKTESNDDIIKNRVAELLAKSRWFTRGWCLQELIAPKHVLFYDGHWRFLGSKSSMGKIVSDISGVDLDILNSSTDLDSVPVARRMSWAAKRQTTRVEDIAYSLLGIFDVNMPMLYGEGEKAFIRLQEEIIKKSNDMSIFAWEPPESWSDRYLDMLSPSPRFFEGCQNIVGSISASQPVLSRNQFEITHRGIKFVAPELLYHPRPSGDHTEAAYLFPLKCFIPQENQERPKHVCLLKVRPGLYARIRNPPLPIDHSTLRTTGNKSASRERHIFVMSRLTPQLCQTLDSSHGSLVKVRLSSPKSPPINILEIAPSEAWDNVLSGFFTQGESSFRAYLKVYYGELRDNPELPDFFILTLEVNKSEYPSDAARAGKLLKPKVGLASSRAWLMESSLTTDSSVKRRVWSSGAYEKKLQESQNMTYNPLELILPSWTVTAWVTTNKAKGLPFCRVALDWQPREQVTNSTASGLLKTPFTSYNTEELDGLRREKVRSFACLDFEE